MNKLSIFLFFIITIVFIQFFSCPANGEGKETTTTSSTSTTTTTNQNYIGTWTGSYIVTGSPIAVTGYSEPVRLIFKQDLTFTNTNLGKPFTVDGTFTLTGNTLTCTYANLKFPITSCSTVFTISGDSMAGSTVMVISGLGSTHNETVSLTKQSSSVSLSNGTISVYMLDGSAYNGKTAYIACYDKSEPMPSANSVGAGLGVITSDEVTIAVAQSGNPVTFTGGNLYKVYGFIDVNGNASTTSYNPDSGDKSIVLENIIIDGNQVIRLNCTNELGTY